MLRWLLMAAGVLLAYPALSADATPAQTAPTKAAITDVDTGYIVSNWYRKFQQGSKEGNCNIGLAALEEGRTGRGAAQAYTYLGDFAERGACMPQDYALAAEYYREAIHRYNDDAIIFLGNLYLKGLGVEQDTARARRLFRRGVLHLIRVMPEYRALTQIMSVRGGIPSELDAELEWLESLPDDRDDLLAMARRLRDGDGFDRDLRAAFLWYKEAMDKGSAEARHELAIMLIDESGVPGDLFEGGMLLSRSAKNGYGLSQMELARRLARGDDGKSRYEDAYFWYLRASDNGMNVKEELHAAAMELDATTRYRTAKKARDPRWLGSGLSYRPPILNIPD